MAAGAGALTAKSYINGLLTGSITSDQITLLPIEEQEKLFKEELPSLFTGNSEIQKIIEVIFLGLSYQSLRATILSRPYINFFISMLESANKTIQDDAISLLAQAAEAEQLNLEDYELLLDKKIPEFLTKEITRNNISDIIVILYYALKADRLSDDLLFNDACIKAYFQAIETIEGLTKEQAITLIATASSIREGMLPEAEAESKINYLKSLLHHPNFLIQIKAAITLTHLSEDNTYKELIINAGIREIFTAILNISKAKDDISLEDAEALESCLNTAKTLYKQAIPTNIKLLVQEEEISGLIKLALNSSEPKQKLYAMYALATILDKKDNRKNRLITIDNGSELMGELEKMLHNPIYKSESKSLQQVYEKINNERNELTAAPLKTLLPGNQPAISPVPKTALPIAATTHQMTTIELLEDMVAGI